MPPTFAGLRWWTWSEWPRAAAAVFALLDVVDVLLCFVYAFLDGVLEDSPAACYCCHRRTPADAAAAAAGVDADDDDDGDQVVSDTLYARRSAVRDALLPLLRAVLVRRDDKKGPAAAAAAPAPSRYSSPRWSDCGCKSCVAWRGSASGGRLHVVVREPPLETTTTTTGAESETAVFVHGFTSSSAFWAETLFRESSSSTTILNNCRLVALDLLGFGQSPKPADCKYTLRDHVEAIETSLFQPPPHSLTTSCFHLVAHSMGCIVALALAAKHPTRVKSITLVAPPYFLPCEQKASQVALSRLAPKKLWPPLLFGSAVMSWYEHIGRTVCLLVCKNHLLWERLFSLLTRKRDVDFRVRDLTQHTHHSAWHTMHNVICGGARLQDTNLEAVQAAGIPVMVVHGDKDAVVPVDCSRQLKAKLPHAQLRLVPGCDHTTVVSGRGRGFADELTAFWAQSRGREEGLMEDDDELVSSATVHLDP